MSTTWWKRKPQILFSQRETDLIIYGPKSLYENSRNQLISCSTWGKHKAKTSCTERVIKSHFISLTIALPLSQHSLMWSEENTNLQLFPWKGESERERARARRGWGGRSGTCIQYSGFSGLARGTSFCLAWLGMLTGVWHTLDAWGPLKIKANSVICYSTRGLTYHRLTSGRERN